MDKAITVRNKKQTSWIVWTVILAMVLLILVVTSVLIVKSSIVNGVSNAIGSFEDTYARAKDDTYKTIRDKAYAIAEKRNHVSNKVSISMGDIKSKASLKVLHVSDVVYVITDAEDTPSGTAAWLKVTGSGDYKVNLLAAEYIIDNNRQYVLIRVPRPQLDSDNIDIGQCDNIYFSENKWSSSNSVKSGEELARNQLNEAKMKIQEDFLANENYSKMAEKTARSMIEALIKGFNPEIDNIRIDVEFY